MNNKDISLLSPAILLATWFGAGLLKPAPGTWGSLATLPFGLGLYIYFGFDAVLIFTVLVTLVGYWAATGFENTTGIHDDKRIVIDEVAGQSLALLPVLYFSGLSWMLIVLAFVFFRVFDILKPWPVSFFDQKVSGALGVMADDIVAGLYAAGVLIGFIYAGIIT